ncbi:amino acid adenylation domain-containing protein [Nonomuraea deserti]|uniref:Amino acid adenylation domain-containing protein n=1 Tax=Nonomuraea deserti TaxID=1848322 RepID=A0A4R4V8A8_9ACTN|nr:non-ribosomal peptide synthetase [Nonomuraea deserti]TDD01518.1 amino acid adenylation domain-containing protein [Nonomuraea deserti]
MSELTASIRALSPGDRAELRQRMWTRGLGTGMLDDGGAEAPASLSQRRIAFLQELFPDNAAYNSPMSCRLSGPLDEPALGRALNRLLDRHPALRTALRNDAGTVIQLVAPATDRPLPLIDLSCLGPDARTAEADRLARTAQEFGFDLGSGPLVRFWLVRLEPEESILLLTFHHAVFDGWSVPLLARDLTELYDAEIEGRKNRLPSLDVDYGEYARWQADWLRSAEAERQQAYWTRQLSGAPEAVTLPFDRPRAERPSNRGASLRFVVPAAVRERLARLAASGDATLFMVLLAGFSAVLSRYSGQNEVVVGTPVANRPHTALRELIGFFANSVALRCRIRPDRTFAELVAAMRETCLDAYDNQDLPLDVLAQQLSPETDISRNPIYQVNLTLHNTPEPVLAARGLTITPIVLDLDWSRFDLDLNIWETRAGELDCQLVYATDLFDAATVRRIADSLLALLAGAAPGTTVRALTRPASPPVLRGPVVERPRDMRVHKLFEARAAECPDSVALSVWPAQFVTYRELDARANAVAAALRERGVRRGDVVAVSLPRSIDLVVVLLGILKADAAYLPIDPGDPAARVAHVLTDSGARLLIAEPGRRAQAGLPVVAPDELRSSATAPPAGAGDAGDDGDVVYVIYTSGTTGRPKGVVVPHRSVANYLLWAAERYELAGGDGVPLHSSVGYDLTVTSVFAPLLAGQRVVVLEETETPAEALRTSAEFDTGLSMVKLTPSHLRLLDEPRAGGDLPPWARYLVIGGEDLLDARIASWRAAGLRCVNEYGPTEAAVACAFHVDDGTVTSAGRIPIGGPVDNATLVVVDDDLAPVPLGAPGELCVGGEGLAYGYWNRPGLTAANFVPDAFGGRAGARLYRTGDRVRFRPDGTLEYLGRIDDQVKIRGHRVEPGEAAATLERHPDVRQAAVLLDDATADARLVGFVSLHHSPDAEAGEVLEPAHVEQWRSLYRSTYADLDPAGRPAANLAGWTSGFDGRPIERDQMASWLAGTTERIKGLRPRRVLEIGCGTGMVLAEIAPACTRYVGSDVSSEAVGYVRDHLIGVDQVPGADVIELRCAPADQSIRPGDDVDTVILNSVVQYFPSADYLGRVLERAVAAIPDTGGHVFVGDVRHLGLLRTFHTAVAAHTAQPAARARDVVAEAFRRSQREGELCLAPAFFTDLMAALPRVTGVRVLLKRGPYRNELTAYRYDVIISVGRPAPPYPDPRDWTAGGMTVSRLEEELRAGRGAAAFAAVPNARLERDNRLLGLLGRTPPEAPFARLRSELDRAEDIGVDPDHLLELGDTYGCDVELSWAHDYGDGSYDVTITDRYASVQDAAPPARTPGRMPPRNVRGRARANVPTRYASAVRRVPLIEQWLAEQLPAWLRPSQLIVVDEMPLAPSGKVDTATLRHLVRVPGEESAVISEPMSPVQERIARIWSELLAREVVRTDADFFELGGHSLLTFQLVARLREEFQVDVPVRAPFNASTVREQADLIGALAGLPATASGPPPLVPVARSERMPTSFAQERLWFLSRLEPESIQYNFPNPVILSGDLDPRALENALDTVLRRHEVLRTVIRSDEGVPYQTVLPHRSFRLPVADLSGLPPEERDELARRLARQQYELPFELAKPPIVRLLLLRMSAREHILLLTTHHIAMDGWSVGVLMDELTAIYAARRAGEEPDLPDLPVQYADYAAWQRRLAESGHFDAMAGYWTGQLEGVTELPGIPTDRPRRPSGAPDRPGRRLPVEIPDMTVQKLRLLCKDEECTLYMALLAAVKVAIARRSQHPSVAVGSDVAGRSERGLEAMIGFFVNQIVVRTDLSGRPTWRELLGRIRKVTMDAYAYQDFPFEETVKALNPRRSRNPSPLFQVKFGLDNTAESSRELPGIRMAPLPLQLIDSSRFDLALMLRDDGDRVRGFLEYDLGLFSADTAERLRQDYLGLLDELAYRPDKQI